MPEKEIWKDIEGWEGFKVSNYGRVKSFKRYPQGTLLKIQRGTRTYHVTLWKVNDIGETKHKTYPVSTLVADAFIPMTPEEAAAKKCYIYHKNRDKSDNRSCNLIRKIGKIPVSSKKIRARNDEIGLMYQFKSVKEAASFFFENTDNCVASGLIREIHKHGYTLDGFSFSYI